MTNQTYGTATSRHVPQFEMGSYVKRVLHGFWPFFCRDHSLPIVMDAPRPDLPAQVDGSPTGKFAFCGRAETNDGFRYTMADGLG